MSNFVGEAEAGQRLCETQDTQERTSGGVGMRFLLRLIVLRYLAKAYVRLDDVVGHLGGNRWAMLASTRDVMTTNDVRVSERTV